MVRDLGTARGHLRDSEERLRAIRSCASASAKWHDRNFPPRARALEPIQERTKYSIPAIEYALDRLFGSITVEALEATIAREIGDREVCPVGRVAIVSSRTTIGVAIVPAVFAICAGCDVLVKDREDHLVRAFFQTLVEEYVDEKPRFTAETWHGSERELSGFDAVVVFGTDETLRAVRSRLAPSARFIPYGPACSIGYITREALHDEAAAQGIARGAARDLVLYESEGCLSLHALFIEEGGNVTPDAFARIMARAIERANGEIPLGPDRSDFTRRMTARDLALFRGTLLASDADARYMLEHGSIERAPAFLPRVLALHVVGGPAAMTDYVRRHRLPLEACAIAGDRSDVVAAAVDGGAHRIARFGEMQAPSLDDAHGGRPRIAEFLRIVSRDEA
jgi:hypothetical protein